MVHKNRHASVTESSGAIYDDCFYYAIEAWDGGIRSVTSSGGVNDGTAYQTAVTTNGHFGVTGVNANLTAHRAGLGNNSLNVMTLGGSTVRFGSIVKIPAQDLGNLVYGPPSGSYDFDLLVGITDSMSSLTPANFVGFYYNGSVPSWHYYTRASSTGSVSSSIATGDTNWHTFELEVNPAGTSVQFWLDGTSVGTTTSNIPSSSTKMGFTPINMIAIAGAGTYNNVAYIDAYWWDYGFTTTR